MAKKLFKVDGIAVKVDERIFTDYRVTKIWAQVSEPLPPEDDESYNEIVGERGRASVKLIELILGDQEEKVVKALAKKHGGYVDSSQVFEWLGKLIQESNEGKK